MYITFNIFIYKILERDRGGGGAGLMLAANLTSKPNSPTNPFSGLESTIGASKLSCTMPVSI